MIKLIVFLFLGNMPLLFSQQPSDSSPPAKPAPAKQSPSSNSGPSSKDQPLPRDQTPSDAHAAMGPPRWQKVLEFFGVLPDSIAEAAKGPGDTRCGDIYVVSRGGVPGGWNTHGECWSSPVFASGIQRLYALQDGKLFRISHSSKQGDTKDLLCPYNLETLIGIGKIHPEKLLVLAREQTDLLPFVVSIKTCDRELIPLGSDEPGMKERAYLAGSARDYGNLRLDVEGVGKSPVVWNVVAINEEAQPPNRVQLTNCLDTDCDQPSLSLDGGFVVYVRVSAKAKLNDPN